MAYSLKTKKEVINQIHQGMTILEASRMYNLSRQTIGNWLKHPDKHLCETRIGREPFDIEEKVEVLRLIEAGNLTHCQIAELKHINLYTIRNWIKDKNRILAVYSSQGHLPMITGSSNSSGEETETVSAADDKDTKQHIRDLKNENEFLKAKVAYLEALMEINGTPVACFKKIQYRAIDKVLGRGIGNVSLLCRVANVSRKSYYYHLCHPCSVADAEITDAIRRIQNDHKGSIGYRPMARLVSEECGRNVNRKRVRRLMKENNLLSAVRRRKWSDEVYAKRRELKASIPADLIKHNFFALVPRRRMLEDITYLRELEKTMYLNTIEDLYNGEILAYCISDSPNAKLCADTIEILCSSWGECFRGAIIHNDLGSSYVSYEYRAAIEAHGIIQSIGRVATCYDNAPMESLNGIIKTEALYCRFGKTRVKEKRVPISEIIEAVIEFIAFYNNERPKASNGGLSPVQFRLQNPNGTYPAVIHTKKVIESYP